MKPYYQHEGITLYHGDAREILPALLEESPFTDLTQKVCGITDPVWPGCEKVFPGIDIRGLWAEVAQVLAEACDRLVVLLGGCIDPRFLAAVPREMPFFRQLRLDYTRPSFRGKRALLGDLGYVFGEPPGPGNRPRPWRRLATSPTLNRANSGTTHPCPRNPDHVRWVVQGYTDPDDVVIDPFSGWGTTLWAAKELGRRAVGIEIEERWCAETVERLAQGLLFPPETTHSNPARMNL